MTNDEKLKKLAADILDMCIFDKVERYRACFIITTTDKNGNKITKTASDRYPNPEDVLLNKRTDYV